MCLVCLGVVRIYLGFNLGNKFGGFVVGFRMEVFRVECK